MNLERGFRRIGWVVAALATPIVGLLAYNASEVVSGYEPRLLMSDFPTAANTFQKPYEVENLGLFHLPSNLPEAEVKAQLKAVVDKAKLLRLPNSERRKSIQGFAAAAKAKYPEYAALDAMTATAAILEKYPVYRDAVDYREFEVDVIRTKRPLWTAGVPAGVVLICAALVQGGISVVAWVIRGFGA